MDSGFRARHIALLTLLTVGALAVGIAVPAFLLRSHGTVTPTAHRLASSAPVRTVHHVRAATPTALATQTRTRSANQSLYAQAERIVRSAWGKKALSGTHVVLSLSCNDGYAVVFWRDPAALKSVEVYLHDGGQGWTGYSGDFMRYGSGGSVVSDLKLPGRARASVPHASCFDS